MAPELVSVLIPTHNRAVDTVRAVQSVLAQTYQRREVIVIDDGSTDDTPERLKALPEVRYIRQERAGPAAARNNALEVASGDFIAPLDSDDVWDRWFLERNVAMLSQRGFDFVFCNWRRDPDEASHLDRLKAQGRLHGEPQGNWFVLGPDAVRRMLLESCPAPSSSLVLRRSSMPAGWNVSMDVADDWHLLLTMVLTKRCTAAFTLERLWLKNIKGDNRYDGRPLSYMIRHLYLRDQARMRLEFKPLLSRSERARWTLLQLKYRVALAYLNGQMLFNRA